MIGLSIELSELDGAAVTVEGDGPERRPPGASDPPRGSIVTRSKYHLPTSTTVYDWEYYELMAPKR